MNDVVKVINKELAEKKKAGSTYDTEQGTAGSITAETYLGDNVQGQKKLVGKKKVITQTTTNLFTRKYVPNPLHDYASYNYVFTIAALTLEEVNFPEVLLKTKPKYPVAQSSGKQGPEVLNYLKNINLNLEYFVEDVEIESIVSPSKKNKHTQFTNMRFVVREPFSIGLFLQTLNAQAARAGANPAVNYTHAPYGLIVDFVGVDANGKPFNNPELRKVIPFYFKKASFSAGLQGSYYECEGVPVTEYGLMSVTNTIQHDVTLSGKTVFEMLQVGERSLMAQLNKKGNTDEKKAKTKQTKASNEPVRSEDIIIYFPAMPWQQERSDSQRKAILEDRAVIDEGYSVPRFFIEKRDETLELLLGQNVIVTNEFTGYEGKGVRVFQFDAPVDYESGTNWLGNPIGSSKMAIADGNMAIIGKTFPEFEKNWDPKKGIFTRNNISLDLKEMTLSFKAGTYITDIIETVILLSEYSLNFVKNPDEIKDSQPGSTPWFRIQPQCFELKDSFLQDLTKNTPKVVIFNVIPYQVPDELFIDSTSYSPNTATIRNNIVKGYNYIYTGLNQDILNFDVQYNMAFYNSIPPKLNKSANTSADGEGKTDAYSVAVRKESIFKVVSNEPRLKGGQGGASIKPQDNVSGEGTENESTDLKIARTFNDRVINSNVDLIQLDLEIIGDPYFLPMSGISNYQPDSRTYANPQGFTDAEGNQTLTGSLYGNSQGEINYMDRMCYIEVNFRTPVDIRTNGNDFIFPIGGGYENALGQTVQLGEFSGLFRVYKINNQFRAGKFTQVLTIVRSGNTGINADVGSKENKKQIQEDQSKKNK